MFTKKTINGCECHDSGDFRIVQQKGTSIYNTYKASSWDKDGNPTCYSSVHKEVDRIEKHPERDEIGKIKKDAQDKPIMIDVPVYRAKKYTTLESAKADCV